MTNYAKTNIGNEGRVELHKTLSLTGAEISINNLPAGAKPVMLSISTSSITDGNDGETTGIEDLIITTDGELMPANSRVYNINGQLVSEDASSFQSLPSGIYIINGKKYIK